MNAAEECKCFVVIALGVFTVNNGHQKKKTSKRRTRNEKRTTQPTKTNERHQPEATKFTRDEDVFPLLVIHDQDQKI